MIELWPPSATQISCFAHDNGRDSKLLCLWQHKGAFRWTTVVSKALAPSRRRNLHWVLPHTDTGAVGEEDVLLLADTQTLGWLLLAGELPGAPVIGELVPRRDSVLIIR
jgi:hypothetical protein